MTLVRDILRELFGLFVDDCHLALAILGVSILALLLAGVDAPMPVTGGVLFGGCLIVLAWSVFSARKL